MTPSALQAAAVQAKLRLMRELLDDLGSVGDLTPEMLERERLVRRAVERVLTQLVDLAASVNSHVVTASTGRAPASYRSSFDDAAELGMLPAQLAGALKPSVGMRNLLVHEYAAVDLARVAEAVPTALESYDEYVRQVARWLADRADV